MEGGTLAKILEKNDGKEHILFMLKISSSIKMRKFTNLGNSWLICSEKSFEHSSVLQSIPVTSECMTDKSVGEELAEKEREEAEPEFNSSSSSCSIAKA